MAQQRQQRSGGGGVVRLAALLLLALALLSPCLSRADAVAAPSAPLGMYVYGVPWARPPGGFVVPSPTSVVIFLWVLISVSAAAAASDTEHGVATARENAVAQVSGSSSPRMKLQIVAVAAQTGRLPFFLHSFLLQGGDVEWIQDYGGPSANTRHVPHP